MNVLLEDLDQARKQNEMHLKEIQRKNQEIAERQALALRELATPIISVGDGVLALPVIGMVDTERSADMMDALLNRVVDEEATHVVIDITGVGVLDTRTADHFLRMARAVRLLGAECFLTGISPTIAQTLAQLGVDTSGTRTLRRLSDALKLVQQNLSGPTSSQRR
jgi:rsbT co-antagonist protein RsbR